MHDFKGASKKTHRKTWGPPTAPSERSCFLRPKARLSAPKEHKGLALGDLRDLSAVTPRDAGCMGHDASAPRSDPKPRQAEKRKRRDQPFEPSRNCNSLHFVGRLLRSGFSQGRQPDRKKGESEHVQKVRSNPSSRPWSTPTHIPCSDPSCGSSTAKTVSKA